MKDKLIATLATIMRTIPNGKHNDANLTMAQALELMTIGYEIGKASASTAALT